MNSFRAFALTLIAGLSLTGCAASASTPSADTSRPPLLEFFQGAWTCASTQEGNDFDLYVDVIDSTVRSTRSDMGGAIETTITQTGDTTATTPEGWTLESDVATAPANGESFQMTMTSPESVATTLDVTVVNGASFTATLAGGDAGSIEMDCSWAPAASGTDGGEPEAEPEPEAAEEVDAAAEPVQIGNVQVPSIVRGFEVYVEGDYRPRDTGCSSPGNWPKVLDADSYSGGQVGGLLVTYIRGLSELPAGCDDVAENTIDASIDQFPDAQAASEGFTKYVNSFAFDETLPGVYCVQTANPVCITYNDGAEFYRAFLLTGSDATSEEFDDLAQFLAGFASY